MKGDVPDPVVDWETLVGKSKNKRRTVGFGKFDRKRNCYSDLEIYLRELSIVDAGVGCAVWDAAIILSRWMFENQSVFHGKSVLELGAGVGLCGLVAAYFADKVVLTDYMPQLLQNLEHNININSNPDMEGGTLNGTKDLTHNTSVARLDWHEIGKPEFDQPQIEPADIVVGSELTYLEKNVDPLINVLKRYMKPNGVFYEVLSDDRTGVSLFLKRIQEEGFEAHVMPVPVKFLGKFKTGQRPETYRLYTFKRPEAPYPVAQ